MYRLPKLLSLFKLQRDSDLEGFWPDGLGTPPHPAVDASADGWSSLHRAQSIASLPTEEPELRAIYDAFDSSQPVSEAGGLYGRSDELNQLINGVLFRRNHGVISGPRGSGKTSIVKVFGERAEAEGVVVLYLANDADTAFGKTMQHLLERVPASSLRPGQNDTFQASVKQLSADSSAQQVVGLLAQLAYSTVVLVIDEFERVPDEAFKAQISSLMKLSSDARLRARLLLVGDERTFADVVAQHPSLSRHTTHVSTGPLGEAAIVELLDKCARRVGMTFADDARQMLADVVCGSPYHARLFGLHAALASQEEERTEIHSDDVKLGLQRAFAEWETLSPDVAGLFRQLVRSSRPSPDLLATARGLAWQASPDASAIGSEPVLADLAPVLKNVAGGAVFTDSTAAQFLIALVVANRRTRVEQRTKEKSYS